MLICLKLDVSLRRLLRGNSQRNICLYCILLEITGLGPDKASGIYFRFWELTRKQCKLLFLILIFNIYKQPINILTKHCYKIPKFFSYMTCNGDIFHKMFVKKNFKQNSTFETFVFQSHVCKVIKPMLYPLSVLQISFHYRSLTMKTEKLCLLYSYRL